MIDLCSRCNREDRMYNTKYKLCFSCYSSIKQHNRRIEGKVSENERQKNSLYFKKYYNKNKAKFTKYNKTYYQKHKNKHDKRCSLYWFRHLILDYYNNKCIQCGSKTNLEIDHIEYESKNKEVLKNIKGSVRVLCRKCHRRSHRLENFM